MLVSKNLQTWLAAGTTASQSEAMLENPDK